MTPEANGSGDDVGPPDGGNVPFEMPYSPDERMRQRIDNDFTYHAPKPGQGERYDAIRKRAKEMALFIVGMTPPSREQSLALTAIEEAVFYANAAVARAE